MGRLMGNTWKLAMAALIFSSFSAFAQGINSAKSNPDGSQVLLNHVPRQVALGMAQKIAHASAGQMLDLRVILPSKNQAGLDNFIKDLYDPKSPNYHKFLTPDQFALMYGASSTDSAIVLHYLKSQGLIVKKQSKSGFVLTVSSQVSTVESAFKVHINNYKKKDGTPFFAPDANPTISPQLAGKIKAIVGMDNAIKFRPNFYRGKTLAPLGVKSTVATANPPATVLAIRGPNGIIVSKGVVSSQVKAALSPAFSGFEGSMGPSDIATAYNLNSVSSNGSGQTIALYELDGYDPASINSTGNLPVGCSSPSCYPSFEANYSLPNVPLTNVCTDESCPASVGDNTDEDILDIDMSIAVAPGLSGILVYEAPNSPSGWIDQWTEIASEDAAKIISCSWGEDEAEIYSTYDHSIFSQLAAQGQTVFAAAGDSGAYANCDTGTLPPNCTVDGTAATGVVSVWDPASDPYVTSAGISALTINSDGTYNSETSSLYGGGGISSFQSMPSYQLTAATSYYNATSHSYGSTTVRNVPDVVFHADPGTITNPTLYGIYVPDGSEGPRWYGFWGSSAAAPIWAAFIARVNEGRATAGEPVIGFLNPILYQIAQSSRGANDFHDISTGTNSYYPAKAGYDDATGLGSFNGANLYNDLIAPLAPTGLTPTPSNAQVALSWTASAGAASYNVKRATVNGGPYTTVSTSGAVTSTNYTDILLTNGTLYYYVVSAVNAAGVEGVNSSQTSATPVGTPSPPTTVTAVAGNGQATISFSGALANGNAITGYTVTASSGGLTGTGSSSPIIVTGLTNGTAYTFTVTATNGIGTSTASTASNSVTPAGTPSAPTTITAVAGNTQATVSFSGASANGSVITSYTVSASSGGFTATGSSSPIIVTGLTDGTAYTFTVTATNGIGTSSASSASNSVTPNIVPAAPTGVSAVTGDGQATVSFTAPAPNGGTAILSYTVSSSSGQTATGASSPIIVTGLTNGTAYTFTVVANNATGPGAASSASNSVTPAGLPIAPTTITAVAGNAQATVSFSGASANGSSITGYTVSSTSGGFTGTGGSSPIIVTGLTNGTAYTFTVTATNGVGTSSASSASNSVTPNIVPAAPTGVSAVGGNGQATVSFTAPAPNGGTAILSYTVTSSSGGFTGTGSSSPIIVTGLTNGTAYTFTVTATNAGGTGAASTASNSVTPAGAPSAPTTVTAVAGNGQATVSFSGASANGNAITGYTVSSTSGGFTGTGSSSPIIVTGLTNGTAYTFTVTATNGVGTSSASSASNSVTPNIVPAAPTGVSAVGGNGQATISFTAPAPNGGTAILSYTVTSSSGGFTGTGSSSPIIVTGLTNGTAYTFTVTATNAGGTGAASTASNSVTPAGAPSAPTTVTAVAGNTQATITFSGASANGNAITGYTVSASSGGFTGTGASSPIIVTGLTNGTAYTFTVTATNGIGTSSASTASNSVTPNIVPAAPSGASAVSNNTGTQVVVSFSAPAPNGGTAVLSYTVTSSLGQTGTGASSPVLVSGLTPGVSYTFTVSATNAAGTGAASASSNSVIPSGPPIPPTTVTVLGGDQQATVSFSGGSPNGSAITNYTVTSNPDGLTNTGSSSPIIVTGLTNGTQYTFTVTVTNGIGTSSASAPSNSVTPSPVAAPTTLSVNILGARIGGQIIEGGSSLTWGQSTSPDIIQNKIYRSAGSGAYELLATVGASTSYADKTMTKGTAYHYVVTADDSNGNESSPSNSVTVNY